MANKKTRFINFFNIILLVTFVCQKEADIVFDTRVISFLPGKNLLLTLYQLLFKDSALLMFKQLEEKRSSIFDKILFTTLNITLVKEQE